MKVPFLDLRAQYLSIRTQVDAAIAAVIEETAFIGGRHVEKFEADFSSWLGVPHTVGCANGTDAIEIVLAALGVGAGDEVIVPAHSWISTSESVSSIGARPIFVDTVPGRYTIDPAKIEQAITPRTKAIIPVHLYGCPADMAPILALSAARNLHVIEDCAQAHGATYRGQKIGTFGVASTFSFYPGKNLGAYGDAGAVVTRDAELAKRVRMATNHGQLKKHDHVTEGRNSRLDGLQAAILSAKLPHLNDWNAARRSRAALYDRLLTARGVAAPRVPQDVEHVFHLYVVEVDDRELVRTKLAEAGVETAVHYPRALTSLDPYRELPSARACSVAPAATSRIISLPMYPELTDDAVSYVVESLARSVGLAR